MKIKNLLLVMAVAAMGFSSCELEDLATTDVDTNLEVDMALEADSRKSNDGTGFSGSGSINLSENDDLSSYTDKFKGFELKEGATFKVEGLPTGLLVKSVQLSVKVGANDWTNLSTYEDEAGYGNGSTVAINAGDITKINTTFENWESSNFEETIQFSVVGSTNVEFPLITVSGTIPHLYLDLPVSVTVGL